MANFNFAAEINSLFLGVPCSYGKSFAVPDGRFYINAYGKQNPRNAVFPHKIGNIKADVFEVFFGNNYDYALESGKIPTRICHNDCNLNNILFDEAGEVLCVIDLDTCMSSTSLNDFGDAIRSGASRRSNRGKMANGRAPSRD